ncbi:MAG: hypothetical protein ACK5MA_08155 [Parachlamydiaceae bacterium]
MYTNSVEWDQLAHVPAIVSKRSSNSFKVFAVSALVTSIALILFGSLLIAGVASFPLVLAFGVVILGAGAAALISRFLVPLLLKHERTRNQRVLTMIFLKVQILNQNLSEFEREISYLIKELKRGGDPRVICEQMKRLLEGGPE